MKKPLRLWDGIKTIWDDKTLRYLLLGSLCIVIFMIVFVAVGPS